MDSNVELYENFMSRILYHIFLHVQRVRINACISVDLYRFNKVQ